MSYSTKLNQLVKHGYSAAYIEATLWGSFSRNHSIQQISNDVDAAIANQR